jgi:hypothetical protein
MDKAKLINTLKIITNLILIICLVAVLFTVLTHKQEIQEAIGSKNPDRLIELYEIKTGLRCDCYNPNALKPYLNISSFSP